MGVVRVAQEKDAQQQQRGDGHRGKDDDRPVEFAVIDAHQQGHGHQAKNRPTDLSAHKGIRRTIAILGHDRGRAEDHQQADEDQQDGHAEEPFVDSYALCHTPAPSFAPRRAITACLKTLPRSS